MKPRRFLGLVAILCLAAAVQSQCGCAVPVRPIAFVEKDAQGRTHFVPDEEQEPKAADVVGWFAPIATLLGGPYGEAGIGILALLLGHQVGHRRGKHAATKAKPAMAPIAEKPA